MVISPNSPWNNALAIIRANVSEQVYNTWFKKIGFESYDDRSKTVILQVPSPFVCEYLEENYVGLLGKALRQNFCPEVGLKYRLVADTEETTSEASSVQRAASAGNAAQGQQSSSQGQSTSAQASDAGTQAANAQHPATFDSQLNPDQTFDNYIEGVCNKLPRSVGETLAEHPNTPQFNPFFIYGPSGSGKTHLINAIGMRTKERYPDKRVLYLSARTFEMQYTTAQIQNKINDFINFYQTIDVLIVDDIQEWENKKGTQNTFFHIFNHLFRNNKRIILAADRPPVELQGMMDRLLTRFKCGLIAPLERPNAQLCMDILNKHIYQANLQIPDDVAQFIASNANGSVRDLQGVLNMLQAYSMVYQRDVDMQVARQVLKSSVKKEEEKKSITVDEIIETVCKHFNVTVADVNSRSRKREFVMARQVSMYLAQKHTKIPAIRIGKMVGGRDHSTVIHSCAQIERKLKVDRKFSDEILSIENAFSMNGF